MTALAIMGLLPQPMARIAKGSIRLADGTEPAGRRERDFRDIRANRISMIFQEPMTSLNPVMTIGRQLTEVLLEHRACTSAEAPACALDLLRDVQITDAERRLKQYPHELSGGMRQRVMIAIALACNPEILIADEPTTALDVTVQAEVLELLRELQQEEGLAYLFISHDMAVIEQVADRVAVMNLGQIVETGAREQVLRDPARPYTRRLLSAVPIPDPEHMRPPVLPREGEVGSPVRPLGQPPARHEMREHAPGHWVARPAKSHAA
ncbi:ABC transporter ATP-binding protein [Rhodovulum sp.]|uniref:ABC transporter ATP-binding protein n=1 Tax=Rhodovulum sp. TaxID=34009 RepID=UPI00257BA3F3|nr:ABC transporter ATP-binding protein [Rhodovulum sp.]